MRSISPLVICLLLPLAGFVGCATKMGPNTVRPDRANYNQAIVDSANEQLLLNLVRLRYRGRPLSLKSGGEAGKAPLLTLPAG